MTDEQKVKAVLGMRIGDQSEIVPGHCADGLSIANKPDDILNFVHCSCGFHTGASKGAWDVFKCHLLMVIVVAHYPSAFAAKVANAPLWMIQIPERGVLGPGISGWEPSELKAWTVAASRLPHVPQGTASVDRNSDEAVVRAAVPSSFWAGEAGAEGFILAVIDGVPERIGRTWQDVRLYRREVIDFERFAAQSKITEERQHPTVQAYERANRPQPDAIGHRALELPSLKRFDLEKVAYGDYAFDHEMREDSNGDWDRTAKGIENLLHEKGPTR